MRQRGTQNAERGRGEAVQNAARRAPMKEQGECRMHSLHRRARGERRGGSGGTENPETGTRKPERGRRTARRLLFFPRSAFRVPLWDRLSPARRAPMKEQGDCGLNGKAAFATCGLEVQAFGPFGFAQGGPDLKPQVSSLPWSLPLKRVAGNACRRPEGLL